MWVTRLTTMGSANKLMIMTKRWPLRLRKIRLRNVRHMDTIKSHRVTGRCQGIDAMVVLT